MNKLLLPACVIALALSTSACSVLDELENAERYAKPQYIFTLHGEPLVLPLEADLLTDNKALEQWLEQADLSAITLSYQRKYRQQASAGIAQLQDRLHLQPNQILALEDLDAIPAHFEGALVLAQWQVTLPACEQRQHKFNDAALHSSVYACASRKNLAMMIANKADLSRGRGHISLNSVEAVSAVASLYSGRRMPLNKNFSSKISGN